MRDAISALGSALAELEQARDELPEDLRPELEAIIRSARDVLRSLEATAGSDPAGGTI